MIQSGNVNLGCWFGKIKQITSATGSSRVLFLEAGKFLARKRRRRRRKGGKYFHHCLLCSAQCLTVSTLCRRNFEVEGCLLTILGWSSDNLLTAPFIFQNAIFYIAMKVIQLSTSSVLPLIVLNMHEEERLPRDPGKGQNGHLCWIQTSSYWTILSSLVNFAA